MEAREGRKQGRGGSERKKKRMYGPPMVDSHTMSEILKNTLTAELI